VGDRHLVGAADHVAGDLLLRADGRLSAIKDDIHQKENARRPRVLPRSGNSHRGL
jgi:hypothetical protein